MHFAVSSLRGKLGGLYACGATFRYNVPLPNIFLTHLFSKTRLKRKDFQMITRLAWAQEVPSSNLGAPTTYFFSLANFCREFRPASSPVCYPLKKPRPPPEQGRPYTGSSTLQFCR